MPNVGLHFNSTRANSAQLRQSSNEVLMVAPTAFGFNDQVGSSSITLPQHVIEGGLCFYPLLGHADDYINIDRKKLMALAPMISIM